MTAQFWSQVGGGIAVGLAIIGTLGLIAVVIWTASVLIQDARARKRADRELAADEARRVLVDVFAAIHQQRQQDAHQARIQLLRTAHAAMQEHERHRRPGS